MERILQSKSRMTRSKLPAIGQVNGEDIYGDI